MRVALVVLGGGCGALARYLIDSWLANRFGMAFPYGTLVINITGSFGIGFLSVFTLERVLLPAEWRIFLGTGLLGGYTTFSTWQYESLRLAMTGSWLLGLLNLGGSVIVGFVAVVLGIILARAL